MWVCNCHPFNDKSLKSYLNEAAKEKKVIRIIDVYRACSGADKPNCASCIPQIRNAVDLHNEQMTKVATPPPVKPSADPLLDPA